MNKKTLMKVAVGAMSCLMAFSMVGCGGGGQADENTLVIGGSGPLTGPAAIYGNAVKNGAQIAVDEINEKEKDFQIAWNMQDDEHDAEKAVNAYGKLQDEGMKVMVGTTTSAPCTAVAAEASEDRVFMLTPSASNPSVNEGKDNVFQICFSDPNQGNVSADYIAENMKGKKVGVIYNNADNYSTGIYDKFKAECKVKGVDIVAAAAFSDDANADFTAQLNKLKKAGAELIFLPIYYTPASNIMTQADKNGYDVEFFGVDGMDGILGLEGFDTKLAEGVMLLTPFTPYAEDEASKDFVKKYEDQFGEKPIQFAADAYDAVYAIYDAFKASGCKPSDDSATICEALIEQFTSSDFKVTGLTGTDMTWNKAGEVDKNPKVCVIKDGKYIEMN